MPLAYLLPLAMGVGGVYLAEGIADTSAALICGAIFFFRFRAILKKMPNEPVKPLQPAEQI